MSKKIKNIVSIILVSIILSMLSGCVNNYQVTNSFKIEDTKSIVKEKKRKMTKKQPYYIWLLK